MQSTFEPNYLNLEYIFGLIYNFIASLFSGGLGGLLQVLAIIGTILAIFFIVVIIYSKVRLNEIHHAEHKKIHDLFAMHHVHEDPSVGPINPRWEQVQTHIKSENESDWRLAILEADLILEDLLKSLGIEGETIGEMLKATDANHFNEYQKAWEAHRVRNGIAHQGSGFILGRAEARRIIGLFEDVFKAYRYI